MPNNLMLSTKAIILDARKPENKIKDLVITVENESGEPVIGLDVTLTRHRIIKFPDVPNSDDPAVPVVVKTDQEGRYTLKVSMDLDPGLAWASEGFINVSVVADDGNVENVITSTVKVFYGTRPETYFLNIKTDPVSGDLEYDRYEKEDTTFVIVYGTPQPPEATLTLRLYLDGNMHERFLPDPVKQTAIDLRAVFDKKSFVDGEHHLYYTLSGEPGNIATSFDLPFKISRGSTVRELKSISIPDLYNGYINQAHWYDGISYDFSELCKSVVFDDIDATVETPLVLRFLPFNTAGDEVELTAPNEVKLSLEQIQAIYDDPKHLYVGPPGSQDDIFYALQQGSLHIDYLLKIKRIEYPKLSAVYRVLVDLLPPAVRNKLINN
ncbi:MAG TPA: hypothetical protein DD649_15995 [Providencia sp.]|uniref:hypothetical protein n=1 Tax=Providencia sp. TaxID=589 RepID=UPI000E978A6B|nr:hypothetical protein [Providencia sp.]MBP6081491.1 hypothetical protein [Providencia sp.]HBO24368.1 hypothetical protein [Providencia sp.]